METPEYVETSPKGGFSRTAQVIGKGSFKIVYKGIDHEKAIDIAWNTISLKTLPMREQKRISDEINLLKKLKHDNIIRLQNAWINREKDEVVFINEIIPGGSLGQYCKTKVGTPKLKVLKKWMVDVLNGLSYLHTQQPYPIIHRDIKPDNIFISNTDGQIKIGDMGLASKKSDDMPAMSILGTPEYMAPEIFNSMYDTGVDIYAFGMTMLELCTQETPYSECNGNAAKILKKLCEGVKPKSLGLLADEKVKAFIELCLAPCEERPSAADLLSHDFLKSTDPDNENNNVRLTNNKKKTPKSKPEKKDQKSLKQESESRAERLESKRSEAEAKTDPDSRAGKKEEEPREPKSEPEQTGRTSSIVFAPIELEWRRVKGRDDQIELTITIEKEADKVPLTQLLTLQQVSGDPLDKLTAQIQDNLKLTSDSFAFIYTKLLAIQRKLFPAQNPPAAPADPRDPQEPPLARTQSLPAQSRDALHESEPGDKPRPEMASRNFGHLFFSNYELNYLGEIDTSYLEAESLENMKIRHEFELNELSKLHVKQKESLIKKLSNGSKTSFAAKETRKPPRMKAIKLSEVKETNEEDTQRKCSSSDEDSFSSLYGMAPHEPPAEPPEPTPTLTDEKSLDLISAGRLLNLLSEKDIYQEITKPLTVELQRDMEAHLPFEIRRLQLALAWLMPESQLVPTGEFGLTTERFVKQLQKRLDLEETGVVTFAMWKRMADLISKRSSATSPVHSRQAQEEERKMQILKKKQEDAEAAKHDLEVLENELLQGITKSAESH